MARTNNLTNFLTDVATAIKTKTGDSTLIPASQFDTKIANITTGHLDNAEYAEANDDLDDILEGSSPVTIYPPDWSQLGYENTPQSVLDDFNYSKNIKDNWDSSITDCSSKYNGNVDIVYMPVVNTSNVTNMNSMFRGANKLYKVKFLDTSNVTDMKSMFQNCSNLVEVPVFDASKNQLYLRYMFSNCPNLSDESLNNILATCISAINFMSTKTLANLGLTSAQATTCQTLSNYQAFVNAGWSTGY